jgi:hypothetical protein
MQISEILTVNETTIPNLVFTKIILADNRLVIKVTHGEDSQLTQSGGGMARFVLDQQPAAAPRDLTQEELQQIAKDVAAEAQPEQTASENQA